MNWKKDLRDIRQNLWFPLEKLKSLPLFWDVQHDAKRCMWKKIGTANQLFMDFLFGFFSLNIDPENIIPIIVCASMSNVCGFYGINHFWTKIARIKTPSPICRPIVAGKWHKLSGGIGQSNFGSPCTVCLIFSTLVRSTGAQIRFFAGNHFVAPAPSPLRLTNHFQQR